ncbi:hypothetical protein AB6A40_010241 [Gnathostoma spinigerum]|uniref:Lipocalin domain-containing protein n=1 Tax=Gnathostoma spinigerum TaxID=75299 RepID=A0ABD6EWN7_9BILA
MRPEGLLTSVTQMRIHSGTMYCALHVVPLLIVFITLSSSLSASPDQATNKSSVVSALNDFAPFFSSFSNDETLTKEEKATLKNFEEIASNVLTKLGFSTDPGNRARQSFPVEDFQSDQLETLAETNQNRVDLQGITSGQIPGLAPIPVPAFPGPQDVPTIPGVNTIPGLSNFNYLIGQLIPQMIPPANTLLGSSISRLLPKDSAKNLAKDVFRAVHPAAENVDVARMMGRWFQVITSPHVIREACAVSHFGALINNTYSATFTILKFYREGNPNGPPRFSLGYGFKAGDTGQFVIHTSNSPDSEPCMDYFSAKALMSSLILKAKKNPNPLLCILFQPFFFSDVLIQFFDSYKYMYS